MSSRTRKWLISGAVFVLVAATALWVIASILSTRYEPYIRNAAVRYLQERFESEVELGDLKIRMPQTSTLRMLVTRGRGAIAEVEGRGLTLRHMARRDLPPMFAIKHFRFAVDLAVLFKPTKRVPLVELEGVEIYIPPKGDRPKFKSDAPTGNPGEPHVQQREEHGAVLLEEVRIRDATLVILPRDQNKVPLRFDIQRLQMKSVGKDVAMTYEAELTNPKPPGSIQSKGTFGPWVADRPSDTPLTGQYAFGKADLSVFHGIAGILDSHGSFQGNLDEVYARGEATIPDFRLKSADNPVPLSASFEVVVDGTNGNTILRPVIATLGKTHFTTNGAVIKRDKNAKRGVTMDVSMPHGEIRDLLRLAVKGEPFMEGEISLDAKIDIPPLSGKVREKLDLDGSFQISDGKFLRSSIQDQIDSLSRRGQGQPRNEAIDEVFANMAGTFKLDDEVMVFQSLFFVVPGAAVDLAGDYDLGGDQLDFHGALRLRAKISQTQTGWKRWVLRPVDPVFAKNGAGTFLRIKVEGSPKNPQFGLERRANKAPLEASK